MRFTARVEAVKSERERRPGFKSTARNRNDFATPSANWRGPGWPDPKRSGGWRVSNRSLVSATSSFVTWKTMSMSSHCSNVASCLAASLSLAPTSSRNLLTESKSIVRSLR